MKISALFFSSALCFLSFNTPVLATENNPLFENIVAEGKTFTGRIFPYSSDNWCGRHELLCAPRISESNFLAFNTVQITARKRYFNEDGGIRAEEDEKGTGFFVLPGQEAQKSISYKAFWNKQQSPLLMTCRHCVIDIPGQEEIISFSLRLKYVDPGKKCFYLLDVSFPSTPATNPWEAHPDGKDMARWPIGNLLDLGKQTVDANIGEAVSYPFLRAIEQHADTTFYHPRTVGYLSELVMFGYPYELAAFYDMPLARFGHCSTDPRQIATPGTDFYVDMAMIAGSSGSPLWFYWKNIKGSLDKDEVDIKEEKEYKFAGMMHAGPEDAADNYPDIHLGSIYNAAGIWKFVNMPFPLPAPGE